MVQDMLIMAEVTRSYSNFELPPYDGVSGPETGAAPTLVEQSEGLEGLRLATNAEPAETKWRSTLPFLDEAVRLYGEGWTVNRIAVELGIAWDSAAKLLERAGVRQRRIKKPWTPSRAAVS